MRYGKGEEPDKEGTIKYAQLTLEGQEFGTMDSAYEHKFQFNEAVSLYVEVDGQEELDYYWEKLTTIPEFEQCGWLKDKYGVSWQIIPKQMGELMEKDKSGKVMTAMLQMKKIDIATLEKAYKEE
jgi:predicted 3-demethylubiquinone-9 3-methyltransferase (glyoxalase superfamily)